MTDYRTDIEVHGPWLKDQERYEDGCRYDTRSLVTHPWLTDENAPPATVTIAYASGKTYRYQVADETMADTLRGFLAHVGRVHHDFTPLP